MSEVSCVVNKRILNGSGNRGYVGFKMVRHQELFWEIKGGFRAVKMLRPWGR